QSDLRSEEPGGSAHQERQHAQRDAGDQHGQADPQLRPLQLLLARHAFLVRTESAPGPSIQPTPSAPRDARHGSRLIIPDHHSPVHARRQRGASAGNTSRASTYAPAPEASVTFNPKRMAITMASTDPSTLEAAFMAQAHSTPLSSSPASAPD